MTDELGGAPCLACETGAYGVTDSRRSVLPNSLIRRRRKCRSCGHKITTQEIVMDDRDSFGGHVQMILAHDLALAKVEDALSILLDGIDTESVFSVRRSFASQSKQVKS